MGKKKTGVRKKSRKQVNRLVESGIPACSEYFENAPTTELLELVEESYASDLVNLLMDLKKSLVRDLFQRLTAQRKRIVRPLLTLYYYKEYLTNPLPLVVKDEQGEKIPNYYAIVGLPRDADPDDIRDAQKLLLQAHEQENFSPEDREGGISTHAELSEAFTVLKNQKKRELADTRLPNIHYLYPRREQSWLENVRKYV